MLKALVLVCSAAAAPHLADCTRATARDVLIAPLESALPFMCFRDAQAYLAGTAIGRAVAPGDRVRIICGR